LGGGGRVAAGEYTVVVGTDVERNAVTIRTRNRLAGPGDPATIDVTYDARNGKAVEVFEAGVRRFAVGDKIQLTRPWRVSSDLQIPNRERGILESIDADGKGTVNFAGKMLKLDLRDMPHLDYGYAMTSYSAQSSTVPRTALHLDMGDSRVRSLLEKALVYVGSSRPYEDLRVFTDDRERLLSEHAPVLKEHNNPMAHTAKEVESIAADATSRAAIRVA
jgi:ATP-dependent exoDNAse (exonuclease V) alpha subunit